jgi:hypothetical protein
MNRKKKKELNRQYQRLEKSVLFRNVSDKGSDRECPEKIIVMG